jgi:hypothetical protein
MTFIVHQQMLYGVGVPPICKRAIDTVVGCFRQQSGNTLLILILSMCILIVLILSINLGIKLKK